MDSASRPRLLLRRLHRVMAGPGSGQERLDRVVQEIARNMVAEVCSVYLVRPGDRLELFSTQGLKQAAVHKTSLKVGEGLVGLIAERGVPLNLSEASEHPNYVYLPETGEEIYHSFMGVPIIRNALVVGVLIVQNEAQRHYTGEEVEAVQTVAMVLAELMGSGELVDPKELSGAGKDPYAPVTLQALTLADGIAAGVAVFHEPKIDIEHLVAEDIDAEQVRLADGIAQLREGLDRMLVASDMPLAGEHHDILETYKMFAYDRGWQERMVEAVESGLTAETAVERAQQDIRARMAQTRDPYLRERLGDLEDLSNRLIRIILGYSGEHAHQQLHEASIIIARAIGVAELLDYDREYLKGVVLEEGSPTAHVTIVARALGIPMLGRVPGLGDQLEDGDRVIVDGDLGRVCIRPTEDLDRAYGESLAGRQELAAEYAAQRDLPAVTKDGVAVKLYMNAGLLIDLASLDATNAAGIGLFRTEFQFMVSSTLPRMAAQTEIYGQVLAAAGDRPVVFRTLDIGGDKRVPFLPHVEEDNPALGWRAIRLALDRPALLRYQIRALLTAAIGYTLYVMFPMVADIGEFTAARDIVLAEVARMRKLGKNLPDDVKIGSMLEVPALAWQLDRLLEIADFLSIGTNDLMQFFFASDRGNPKLADRYDLLSPAALSFIHSVSAKCKEADVPVTLCGEMGSRPLEAMALIGLGLTRLSISPPSIGPVKMMLRNLDLGEFSAYLQPLLSSPEHSLRSILKAYAEERHIPI